MLKTLMAQIKVLNENISDSIYNEFDIDEIIGTYKKDLKRTFEEHRNPVMTGQLSDRRNRR